MNWSIAATAFLIGVGLLYLAWRVEKWMNQPLDCAICDGDCLHERDAADPDRRYNLPPDVF